MKFPRVAFTALLSSAAPLFLTCGLTGCVGTVTFDPRTIAPDGTIGVAGLHGQSFYLSGPMVGGLGNLKKREAPFVHSALSDFELKLYAAIAERFSASAPSAVDARFTMIEAPDYVRRNREIDLPATSRKLGLDAAVRIVVSPEYRKIIQNGHPFWRVTAYMSAEMIRAADGETLWQANAKAEGWLVEEFELMKKTHMESYFDSLVGNSAKALLAGLRGKQSG